MRKKQGLDEMKSITGTDYGLQGTSTIPRHFLSPQATAESLLSTSSVESTLSICSDVHSSVAGSWSFPWNIDTPPSSGVHTSGIHEGSSESMFGGRTGLSAEEDRRRIEERLEAFKGPCLLDCIEVELSEVDVFSAVKVRLSKGVDEIVRQAGNVLKEKGAAKLYIERNLYEDFCRDGS